MTRRSLCVTFRWMAAFAAIVLFVWGAVTAGYGAYAAVAALSSQSTLHAAQAGLALLISTVSISAAFLVVLLGRLGRGLRPPRRDDAPDPATG